MREAMFGRMKDTVRKDANLAFASARLPHLPMYSFPLPYLGRLRAGVDEVI